MSSNLLEEPAVQTGTGSATSHAERLRTTMMAMRLSFTWFGTRKTLSPDQKDQAAESFGAEGSFLSAGKKLIDVKHPAFKAVSSVKNKAVRYFREVSLPYAPVTLDVNGTVAVRAQGQDPNNRMELALTGATCGGEPVRVVVNRAYLTRAARLGFQRLHLFGRQSPLMAADDHRRYVWMPVDPKMAVEPAENITRIESPAPGRAASADPPRPSSIRSNNTPMPDSSTTQSTRNTKARGGGNGSTNGAANGRARSEPDSGQATSAIEQVIALRTTLREAATQATELVRLLKAEKRQTRQLRSALSSLRELQPLDV